MANVNDAGKLGEKHRSRVESVKEADIDDSDREAILAFHDYRRAREGCELNTLMNDLSALKCASKRAEVSLLDMSKTDVDDLLVLLATPKDEGGYGLDPDGSGMFNYCRAFRPFFRWLDGRDDYGDYPFHDEIELPTQNFSPPPEDDLLNPEDVQALKDAAGRGRMNARDRALVAFLADGPRVTAAAQLRVGDVDVYGDNPTWRANDDGVGQKGLGDDTDDADERPFLWSTHEVRRWLSHGHPDPDNPEAPLWTKQSYDPENPQDGALSPDGIRTMLDRNAERAEIEKAVNPHSFRHAAVTRCRREEVDTDFLRVIAGWSDMRPLEAYDHVTDDERNTNVRDSLGLPTPDTEDDEDLPPFVDCWNCGEDVERGERFCSACGQPQDQNVRLAREQASDDVQDGLPAGADDEGETLARAEVLDALKNDEELLDDLAGMLAEREA